MFTLADGSEAPKVEPLKHSDSFYKTSLSTRVDVEVVEYQIGNGCFLKMTCTEGWEYYGTECLMRVVALRVGEGYVIDSATDTSVFLKRLPL